MRKTPLVLILSALVFSQPVLAHDMHSKACDTVANACLKAGFVRAQSNDKGIWDNCMKPIMLGHTVKGVEVSEKVAETCRTDRIEEMKKELTDLQAVQKS